MTLIFSLVRYAEDETGVQNGENLFFIFQSSVDKLPFFIASTDDDFSEDNHPWVMNFTSLYFRQPFRISSVTFFM